MRTFIAIELPKDIKDTLARLQEQLKISGADVKWVKPDNIHLTLKFLGEIDEQKLNKIMAILDDVTKDRSHFYLSLSSIGAFPKINYPRVIWIRIDKGEEQVKELAKVLEERIEKVGIPREDRPFSSHITVGRVRSNLHREQLVGDLVYLQNNPAGGDLGFGVARITLFKSTLTPQGPIYEVLKEASLKTT